AKDPDEHPGRDVLLEGLLDAELLRPLDVVADRARVDARPRNHEAVVDLDRLELHDSRAGEPREDDVLDELRLRSGRRARGRRGARGSEADGEVELPVGPEEAPRRKVVNRLPRLELFENAREMSFDRLGVELHAGLSRRALPARSEDPS